MKYLTKARIKSNHHGLCRLGYFICYIGNFRKKQETFEQIFKNFRSSDCLLQLEGIKKESLVIANQQVAVNTYWSSVQTARHGPNGVLPQVGKVVYIALSL